MRLKNHFLLSALICCSLMTSTTYAAERPYDQLKVIPGGQTIGVKLQAKGLLVVGHHLIQLPNGTKLSPAANANIRRGDQILRINGTDINSTQQFSQAVQQAGETKQPIHIEFKRLGKLNKVQLTPIKDQLDGKYRLGIYIRDQAAGVGTLTFFAPDEKVYGALGHVISDVDTRQPIPVGDGKIVYSKVLSIEKSLNGQPGEKHAQFWKENEAIGTIKTNSSFGIFGSMQQKPQFSYNEKPMNIATIDEVKEGDAKILTVLKGHKVEAFSVKITHVSHQTQPALKGIVLKVTDKRLLNQTGGIVQGMSGSPIIQNNHLVGAVTHVFVNNPKLGYGCFVEWMLADAGIKDKQ